jgi:1-carboxybiuret hydrolase subunit AtzG-like
MTKRAKSLSKSKSKTSRKPTTKAARVKSKTARKPPARDPLDAFVDAAAHALALSVEPAWKGTVKANFAVTLALAASFADFPLPDDAEPAPVFTA